MCEEFEKILADPDQDCAKNLIFTQITFRFFVYYIQI